MSFHAIPTRTGETSHRPVSGSPTLQRKCACGQHTGGGECKECRSKKLPLPRHDRRPGDPRSALGTLPHLQLQPLPGLAGTGFGFSAVAALGAGSNSSPGNATDEVPTGLIVGDEATELLPSQLHKTEFLDRLQTATCGEAEEALAGTGRSTDGCPFLASWFTYYRGQSAEHVESALRRYAPEARAAGSAAEYIPLVAARVRQGVARWASTGEITGVPHGVPLALPGSVAAGQLTTGIAGLFLKARDGAARAAGEPMSIQQALGSGRPLEGGVRRRMETAFGRSFADVRTHTDQEAKRLASEQNARAFTVGRNVAFGSGEYRPGSLVGDALIAHELAHVLQQGGASAAPLSESVSNASYGALERDADEAAVSAVASVWGKADHQSTGARDAAPSMRSVLRLQRCASTPARPTRPSATGEAAPQESTRPEEEAPSAEDEAAAARARAVDVLVSDSNCQPAPISLDKMAAIPGASSKHFGWTKQGTVSSKLSTRFNPRTNECFLAKIPAGGLTFEHMVHVEPGEHRYGGETRHEAGCGKALPLYVDVTPDAAKLFKAGEVEHCRDLRRAYGLTYAKFDGAAAAVKSASPFPAKNNADCTAQIKKKISAGMGFDYDQLRPTFECLAGKSKARDSKGWHDVDVELTREKRTDPGCTKIVHVLDDKRIAPEIGKHPTDTLVRGCGEPPSP